MPIEIITLASIIVKSFLLPYLQKGTDEFLHEIASKSGNSMAQRTVEVTEKIWKQVKLVYNSEGDKVTLQYFEKNPEKFEQEMQETLSHKLRVDQDLARYLSDLASSKLHGSDQTAAEIIAQTITITMSGNSFGNGDNVNIAGRQLAGDSTTDAPLPDVKKKKKR